MKKIITILILSIAFQSYGQCWEKVANGVTHTVARKVDGSLWAWGLNDRGQVGDGTALTRTIPKQISTATNWDKVAAGGTFCLATKTDGTLWGWGYNTNGQVGPGAGTYRTTPFQIGTLTDWGEPSCGENFSACLKTNGELWVWGNNDYGQLGDGTIVRNNNHSRVGGTATYISMDCGYYNIHAVKSDGTLWSWGRGNYGQLGNNTQNIDSLIPIQIGTDTDWVKVKAGNALVIAQKSNGTLWGWGRGDYGQTGSGGFSHRRVPTQIGTATDWISFDAGNFHAVATKSDGSVWSWGYNAFRQLGDATTVNKSLPVRTGPTTFLVAKPINAGINTAFGIKSDGSLWGWGDNSNWMIGNNSSNSFESTPVAVSCPASVGLAVNGFEIADNLKVYPNPIKDILNISFDNQINIISIYNLLGQEIISKKVNANDVKIDVLGLNSGTYFVKVIGDNFEKIIKVIK